eukprot:10670875-Lingulodinium_polyedra.AAC.1
MLRLDDVETMLRLRNTPTLSLSNEPILLLMKLHCCEHLTACNASQAPARNLREQSLLPLDGARRPARRPHS